MTRWLRLSGGILAIAACSLSLSGCYEGFDEGQTPTLPGPDEPPPPVPKAIAYVLFQPIMLGAAALASDDCYPQSGLREYRAREWSDRAAKAGEALADVAESVHVASIEIAKSDCDKLAAVTAAAVDPAPWDEDEPVVTDDRPVVHLTAAFYDGEPALDPPALVTQESWTAMSALSARGVATVNLRYFVLANPADGYFSAWRTKADAAARDGTAISEVDPTPDGIAARTATIERDSAELVAWVTAAAAQGGP